MRKDVKRIFSKKSLRPVRAYQLAYFTRAYADVSHVVVNTFPGNTRVAMHIERLSAEALGRADALEIAHTELRARLRSGRATYGTEKRIRNHIKKIKEVAGVARRVYEDLLNRTVRPALPTQSANLRRVRRPKGSRPK